MSVPSLFNHCPYSQISLLYFNKVNAHAILSLPLLSITNYNCIWVSIDSLYTQYISTWIVRGICPPRQLVFTIVNILSTQIPRKRLIHCDKYLYLICFNVYIYIFVFRYNCFVFNKANIYTIYLFVEYQLYSTLWIYIIYGITL